MTWQDYLKYFEEIITSHKPAPPYNEEEYFHYTKMNWSRSNRWLKNNPLTDETKTAIRRIGEKQTWELMTEPWCGDAAHIVPVIFLMSCENPNITLNIQLRDVNSEIENYLTNGTKSIPIFIVRDNNGKDLFHWGPRPAAAKLLFENLKKNNSPFEDVKTALQNFYNKDKALGIQEEIIALLKK